LRSPLETARHNSAVSVALDPVWGLPRIATTSWIGVIKLPSGRDLRISTKVPVASVFQMLATVGEWPFRPEEIVGYAPESTILFVVARFFRDQLRRLDDGGLYRAYQDRCENLTVLRGRIDFREDLRRNIMERQRTACTFADFTRDIPENQVLRQAAHLLSECGLVGELASDFRALDYWWSDIQLTDHDPNVVTTFNYHRLNDHYRAVHQLAGVLLRWLSPGGAEGDRRFPAFLVNMNWLYEEFVRAAVANSLRGTARVRKPGPLALDEAGRGRIQPDLLFEDDEAPFLVGDCKYKRVGADIQSNADLYQILAYCSSLGLSRGALVYPRHLVDVDDELVVRNSPIRLRRVTIDLGVPLGELAAECQRVSREMLRFAGLPRVRGEQVA